MTKLKLTILLLLAGFYGTSLKSQEIAPQLWNNVSVAWNINDKFSWRNTTAFNVLLSGEYPWFEETLNSTVVY